MKGKAFRHRQRKSDFFNTPYSITQQLMVVHKEFRHKTVILEPCCGDLCIVKILQSLNIKRLIFFDKYIDYSKKIKKNKNFSINNEIAIDSRPKLDFLEDWNEKVDYIITNPPFSLADAFIEKAREVTKHQFCFFLPLSYLNGITRYREIRFRQLKYVYVFARQMMLYERVLPRIDGCYPAGMYVYAWFVWEKGWTNEPVIRWINNQEYILNGKSI